MARLRSKTTIINKRGGHCEGAMWHVCGYLVIESRARISPDHVLFVEFGLRFRGGFFV